MELLVKNTNTIISDEPKEISTPLADTFERCEDIADPATIKILCKNLLKNDEVGFKTGDVSRSHMVQQAGIFQDWFMTVSLGSSPINMEECSVSMLIDYNIIYGDFNMLNSTDKKLVSDFHSMPLLETIYVFKSNSTTDFWFVLSEYDHAVALDYARKFRLFIEDNNCSSYDFLSLSKDQICLDEIPSYTCAFSVR